MTLWRRWLAFLAERETGTTLALARIAFGVTVIGTVLSIAAQGMVPVLFLAPEDGGILPFRDSPWIYGLLGGRTPAAVWSLLGLLLVAGSALVVGLGGRVTAFATLQLFMWTVGLNGLANASHTLLISNGLWLLVLADSTATWSLDAKLRTGRCTREVLVAAWPRRLMVLQIVVVYFMAGVHKVSSHWLPVGDATALYFILRAPNWSTVTDHALLVALAPVTRVMTACTWLYEVTSPLVLVWFHLVRDPRRAGRLAALARRFDWRFVFLGAGVGMHVGIELTMNVGPFSYAAMSYYFALVRPAEWRVMIDRVRRLSKRFR